VIGLNLVHDFDSRFRGLVSSSMPRSILKHRISQPKRKAQAVFLHLASGLRMRSPARRSGGHLCYGRGESDEMY
jgi:hypothetical protein